MKKIVILIMMMFLWGSILLISSPLAKQDLYIKAVSEKDPELKIQLLKQYEQLYGETGDKYLKFIYLQLAETFFQVKNYDEAIQYGEKALASGEIAPTNRLTLFYALANSYHTSQKDLEKAYKYADSMIELAQWVIDKAKNSDLEELEKEKLEQFVETYKKYYIASGYRLQAKVLFSRAEDDVNAIKDAAQKAVEAYKADKSENSSRLVFSLAGQLFKKNNLDDAVVIVENIFDEINPDEQFAGFLGTLYYRKGNKDKAVQYFELAYRARRKIKTAMTIGKLVYKKDIDKGIQYFADAFILSNSDEASKAFQYLRELYYNKKAKDLAPAKQDKGFKEIIQAAKVRLGTQEVTGEAATTN
jgi:tetratricopeptide (TPR) repeat protein